MEISKLTYTLTALFPLFSLAQGNNTGYGGDKQNKPVSLMERVLKLEKKQDAFNVYLNFSGAGGVELSGGNRKTGFACKQLRLEIKGNLTDHLYYRLRHRLNKANYAAEEDNFAKATDYMMVGYRLNEKWTIQAGKMCQYWGGYEFDANPMYIYQYSDMVDNLDSPKAGLVVMYKPIPSQELVVEVSNSRNENLETSFPGIGNQGIKDTRAPLAYILNWNGSIAHDLIQTRWSWGLRKLAEGTYSRQMILGQRLNLPTFQCYLDYSYESDDIDRIGIITREAKHLLPTKHSHFEKVGYHSLVAKADWQFTKQWNAYIQGMYETASVRNGVAELKDYRKHYSYFAGIEYYPDKSQDLRISLSYFGQSFCYSKTSELQRHDESRIELGMMYRIKCF